MKCQSCWSQLDTCKSRIPARWCTSQGNCRDFRRHSDTRWCLEKHESQKFLRIPLISRVDEFDVMYPCSKLIRQMYLECRLRQKYASMDGFELTTCSLLDWLVTNCAIAASITTRVSEIALNRAPPELENVQKLVQFQNPQLHWIQKWSSKSKCNRHD